MSADPVQQCSFCNEPRAKVKCLVAGPGFYICDTCIALCQELVDDAKAGVPAAQGACSASVTTPAQCAPEAVV